jgi:transposase
VDETGLNTKMARLYGRSPKGERLRAAIPHGWSTTTFIAGLRLDGVAAPMLLPGALDGPAFVAWVDQVLVPELRPGDLVILDNLSVHKNAEARDLIRAAGAERVLLPPYSPDFNPIEQAFAKLKALLRAAAARTRDALHDAVRAILQTFTASECLNYFANSGYDLE